VTAEKLRPEDIFRPIGDVTDGALPPSLEHNLLHPTLDTFIYAFGGTGKGVITAWCAAQDSKNGRVVGILDYENNPDEWYRRYERFGGVMDLLRIVSPSYEPGGFLRGPVWEQAAELASAIAALGIGRVYLDSVVPATEVDESQIGSPAIPTNYFRAMRTLGVPTVSIGHASGAVDKRSLAKPWGSHYWRNIPRITWALFLDERRSVLEVFVTKRNAYRKRSYELDWAWADELSDGDTPTDLTFIEVSAPGSASAAPAGQSALEAELEQAAVDIARIFAPDQASAQRISSLAAEIEKVLPASKRGARADRFAAVHTASKRPKTADHIASFQTGKKVPGGKPGQWGPEVLFYFEAASLP
jgi:hypothetical protein